MESQRKVNNHWEDKFKVSEKVKASENRESEFIEERWRNDTEWVIVRN